jgi:hypothetical protein
MKYEIACSCGTKLNVSEGEAGGKVRCPCGLQVEVPRLRELRRLSGESTPKPPPERVIQALLVSKNLPEEKDCLTCHQHTDYVVRCIAKCGETEVYQKKSFGWDFWILSYLFGILPMFLIRSDNSSKEVHWGPDRTYLLPLRICKSCEAKLNDKARLRQAMNLVPDYQSLLEDYPGIELHLYQG